MQAHHLQSDILTVVRVYEHSTFSPFMANIPLAEPAVNLEFFMVSPHCSIAPGVRSPALRV
jgi:hypothetical protein